jgi:adenosine kinase
MLNVSFMVPDMRREFGGCAGNIAYNLHLLGGDALPMATVGRDFAPYAKWMDECGIKRDHIREIDSSYTAQAFITTDQADNQITAFHPGAMMLSHENQVTDANNISLGIISPDGFDGMIEHAQQFAEAGIPFIFDPGQGMPMFDGDALRRFIEQATWVTVNDYEWQLMQERTGWDEAEVVKRVEALIVTRGGNGSDIYLKDRHIQIPNAKVENIVDPTGCGDAYRGGLLFGLVNQLDWETTGRIASLMGAIKIEQAGTQNHQISLDSFKLRYQQAFGQTLSL